MSSRNIKPDAVVVDGGRMLHSAVHWPIDGILYGVCNYIVKILRQSDVYLAFDRYIESSGTRVKRIGNFKRTHNLSLETQLHPKELSLTSNKTKENLIQLIDAELIKRVSKESFDNKLVVLQNHLSPEQSHRGLRLTRHDMQTTFDEAGYIIPHQVVSYCESCRATNNKGNQCRYRHFLTSMSHLQISSIKRRCIS